MQHQKKGVRSMKDYKNKYNLTKTLPNKYTQQKNEAQNKKHNPAESLPNTTSTKKKKCSTWVRILEAEALLVLLLSQVQDIQAQRLERPTEAITSVSWLAGTFSLTPYSPLTGWILQQSSLDVRRQSRI